MPERLSPIFPGGIKKVHVGCGPHAIMADWWNTDIRKFPGIDEAVDATAPWPYRDLHYVFAEHFIEHLTLDQGVQFLTHAGNSLREGGVIRLSTPNLEWVVYTHFAVGQQETTKRLNDTLKINRAFKGWGHQFLYSTEMLAHILRSLGYQNVTVCDYGKSQHPDLDNLEKHGKYGVVNGFPTVIILEATRGPAKISASTELSELLHENFSKYVAGGH